MRPSAEPRGFTLLEVMVTVAIVGITIVPLLEIRQTSSNMAFQSRHLMRATELGQELLAERLLDTESAEEQPGTFAADPGGDMYRWVLTIEDFDLTTGRKIEPEPFAPEGMPIPPDAGTSPKNEDDPFAVRRYKLVVSYPALDPDQPPAQLVLESYAPRLRDSTAVGLLGGP